MSNTAVEKVKQQATATSPALTMQTLIDKSIKELGRALPSHMNAERMARIALTTLKVTPKLYECDPYTFLGALFQCAQLGLEPNIEGQAYIIPYNVQGRMVAQFQVGYKGFVELFYRHQNSVSLQMETVRKNDRFHFNTGAGTVDHEYSLYEDRGEAVAYYAIAHLKNGGRTVKVMSKKEAVDFAKRFSKCWKSQDNAFMRGTPWAEHFDAMAMKTVLKQLMKLLPKSVEIQKALAFDETVKRGVAIDMTEVKNIDDHAIDAEAIEAPAADPITGAIDALEAGKCAKCGEGYAKGSKIVSVAGGKAVHPDCQ